MSENKNEKSLEQKIEEREETAISYYAEHGVPDGEKNISAYLLYRTKQLIEAIKAGSEKAAVLTDTTNRLTTWIRTLTWILVGIGVASLAIATYAVFIRP